MSHDRTRYQGKNLFYLVAAICVPAGLLYVRLVLGLAASDSRVGPKQSLWLSLYSSVALVLFFVSELICARYIQKLLTPSRSRTGNTVQYALVLVTCVLFSLTGAIVLEAFGLNVFLRAGFR